VALIQRLRNTYYVPYTTELAVQALLLAGSAEVSAAGQLRPAARVARAVCCIPLLVHGYAVLVIAAPIRLARARERYSASLWSDNAVTALQCYDVPLHFDMMSKRMISQLVLVVFCCALSIAVVYT
jgi:hypothetical protein